MRQAIFILLIGSLAGCGGYHKAKRDDTSAGTVSAPIAVTPTAVGITQPAPQTRSASTAGKPFARGPLERACMSSNRRARSSELCGCIQAVANDTLTGAQQRRAVGFYSDPHEAQVVRQSSNANDRSFWTDYRAFGTRAERVCG